LLIIYEAIALIDPFDRLSNQIMLDENIAGFEAQI